MTLSKEKYRQMLADATTCPDSGHAFDTLTDTKLTRRSIDRIDNSKGYEPDNVRVVTYKANIMRGGIPFNAWIAAAAVMRDENLWPALLKS